MLLAGDEMGNSQNGNNNAYAQDNPTGWVTWDDADTELAAFTARLLSLRRAHPILRQPRFLHAAIRAADGLRDVIWRRADGEEPTPADWHDAGFRCLGLELRPAATSHDVSSTAIYMLFNAGAEQPAQLPSLAAGWQMLLDTTRPNLLPHPVPSSLVAPKQSVLVFTSRAPADCP